MMKNVDMAIPLIKCLYSMDAPFDFWTDIFQWPISDYQNLLAKLNVDSVICRKH